MINKRNPARIRNSIIEFLESRFEETASKQAYYILYEHEYQNTQVENRRDFIVRKNEESKSHIMATSFDFRDSVILVISCFLSTRNLLPQIKIAEVKYPAYLNKSVESNKRIVNIFDNIEDIHNALIFLVKAFSNAFGMRINTEALKMKIDAYDSMYISFAFISFDYKKREIIFSIKENDRSTYRHYSLTTDKIIELTERLNTLHIEEILVFEETYKQFS